MNAEQIENVDDQIVKLGQDMLDVMRFEDGIGLAGPQVSVLKQIFVCQVHQNEARVFINPQIIATSHELLPYEEGCLSIPGVFADVKRPAAITVQALNERGRPFKIDAEGVLARVIQHEMDHLRGVLFVDYLDEEVKKKLLKIYDKKMSRKVGR